MIDFKALKVILSRIQIRVPVRMNHSKRTQTSLTMVKTKINPLSDLRIRLLRQIMKFQWKKENFRQVLIPRI